MKATANDFHGLELHVRSFSGATAVRIIHPPLQKIDDHTHDWPCLTPPVLGAYTEEHEGGSTPIWGPAAVLHPKRSAHSNQIGARGLETFSIQFDPAWVGNARGDPNRASRSWTSGSVVAAARRLASIWSAPNTDEKGAQIALQDFLQNATRAESRRSAPSWLGLVDEALEEHGGESLSTHRLARRLGLHPAWIARAYRQFRGEGLRDTLRRRRVERAVELLRRSQHSAVEIAQLAGFCDQSHMSRALRALLGRTPGEIRQEGRTIGDLPQARKS